MWALSFLQNSAKKRQYSLKMICEIAAYPFNSTMTNCCADTMNMPQRSCLRQIAHGQTDALALFVNLEHADAHDVADPHDLRRVLDEAVADL